MPRAYDLGLVSEIVERDALMDRAWEIADVVNRNAPLAVRGTRLAIRKTLSLPTYEAAECRYCRRVRMPES